MHYCLVIERLFDKIIDKDIMTKVLKRYGRKMPLHQDLIEFYNHYKDRTDLEDININEDDRLIASDILFKEISDEDEFNSFKTKKEKFKSKWVKGKDKKMN